MLGRFFLKRVLERMNRCNGDITSSTRIAVASHQVAGLREHHEIPVRPACAE